MRITIDDYVGPKPAWCPGCGNFGILSALKKAFVELHIEPHRILIVSGIGQAGKLPHYTRCNVLNGLHGRAVPAAIGAKIANLELTVIALGGDGDGYGEGGNHWLHALRRNHQITYLVHNNQIYGLTKGQASPTSDPGFVTKTTPDGAAPPVNPISIAIAAGGTFVARGFAGDINHLAEIVKLALKHQGFAFIDILQPCVSFNQRNTHAWYKERVYKLENEAGYNPTNKLAAFQRAQEWGEKIPIGVIYRSQASVFEDSLPVLRGKPLTWRKLDPKAVTKLLEGFV